LVPGDTNGDPDAFVRDRQTGMTERVSVDSSGGQGNLGGGAPSISADGRFVSFTSASTNLVPDDTNGNIDIFVHDRQTGATERVSVSSTGVQADHNAFESAISSDGRFVTFESQATTLVPEDSFLEQDIFVRDRLAGTTERVSDSSTGGEADDYSQAPALSSDGRFVTFESAASNVLPNDTNGFTDIYRRDRLAGVTERVSLTASGGEGNFGGEEPALGDDGGFVSFSSFSNNLVDNDTNNRIDIFVRHLTVGPTPTPCTTCTPTPTPTLS